MADISLRYQTIMDVHDHLHAAYESTVASLTDMQTKVDALVQQDGGLWMNQTSPVIQTVYDNFTASAKLFVDNFDSFASMFRGLVQGMESSDYKMAYQLENPPAAARSA